ncbi:NADP-dependent oxidoreductase [Methylobacterium sp. WL64]|uniref:NADP-dependent oxidoreductase n=1 Tax=Methylobacterium sp. WL64 TaxID=2603894 RepID=UPI0011CBAFB4|nr:NADP-dependent oxidoreductase [Methylobacterium sp. WL64]TXM98850.1 NADP-dependent oxidoreductase [Methylobacterium sp. WL64]
MKAWCVRRFGGPEVIDLDDVPVPEPGPGEVLMRVCAAGVGPWDGWIRAGRSVLPQPLPLTLGSDLSGEIKALGDGVTQFAIGDAVFGVTNKRFTGAYAEYAVAAAGMLAWKPQHLDHVAAASVPVVGVTALQALFAQARLVHGQSVLIHGAAGNVGAYAVQLAKGAGIRVSATAGAADLAYVRDLGADAVIDYRTTAFEDAVRDVDAVVDLVGGAVQDRSFAVLRRGGRLISAVSQPDQMLAERAGVEAKFFLVDVTSADLAQLATMLDDGSLTTTVGTVLSFGDARIAHEMLEGTRPRPRGKIVLKVDP